MKEFEYFKFQISLGWGARQHWAKTLWSLLKWTISWKLCLLCQFTISFFHHKSESEILTRLIFLFFHFLTFYYNNNYYYFLFFYFCCNKKSPTVYFVLPIFSCSPAMWFESISWSCIRLTVGSVLRCRSCCVICQRVTHHLNMFRIFSQSKKLSVDCT